MHNKPKYSLKNNFFYALNGLRLALKSEMAFRIEIFAFIIGLIILFSINVELKTKALLLATLFLPLIAEMFNSAIESVVDLVSPDQNPLAGKAKDLAAAGVLLSVLATLGTWGYVFFDIMILK